MNTDSVQELIERGLNQPVTTISPIMGGDSHHAYSVLARDGTRFFAKWNTGDGTTALESEFDSLQTLHALGAHWYPQPISTQRDGDTVVLVMEYLDLGRPIQGRSAEDLGRLLAMQHRLTSSKFGWVADNHIGRTPQLNNDHSDWVTFYRECRLAPQLNMATRRGLPNDIEAQILDLMSRLDEIIDLKTLKPALLHGDLWAGNASITLQGEPIFFDPAPYFGDPLADIAMTRLFGGFPHEFYAAYYEVISVRPQAEMHCKIYDLYHALNHFNLFGAGYLSMLARCLN